MESLDVRDVLRLSEYDKLVCFLKKQELLKDKHYSWALHIFKTNESLYLEHGTLMEFGNLPDRQKEVDELKMKIQSLGYEIPDIDNEILKEIEISLKETFATEVPAFIYKGFTLERFEEVRDLLIRRKAHNAEFFQEPDPQKIYKLLWNIKD